MDETTLTPEPYLCKGWRKRGKGQQTCVAYPAGSRWALHLFGGYNVTDDSIAYTLAAARDSEGFIAWLEHLLRVVYPTQAVCVVLDNASFHRSAAVQAVVALFGERLRLFFLPAYSPELNPIERYWRHLKSQVLGNRMCTDKALATARIHQQFALQNDPTCPTRYALCH